MRVAFLGLGIMGSRMAANVSRAGFELTVWNRTAEKAERFCAENPGTSHAGTPAEAAAEAELVITMVVDGAQVESVLLDEPHGAALGAKPGTLFVDCSTIGPAATREIAGRLGEHELALIDAPVTGSSPKAADGTLTIMVGGTDGEFERARPVYGQLVKLINNAVAAANAATLGQALIVGARTGADLDALTAVMAAGAGASTMLSLKARPMRDHDYSTLFKLDHMLKDVRLCLDESEAAGAPFPFAALTRDILSTAAGMGYGEEDFAALIEALEAAAGTKL
jgi:3-hydroxyisobutyrate dehydrogenase